MSDDQVEFSSGDQVRYNKPAAKTLHCDPDTMAAMMATIMSSMIANGCTKSWEYLASKSFDGAFAILDRLEKQAAKE